jgi:MFS family permease
MLSKSQSASVSEESAGGAPPVKTWSVGTLTYTFSGLIALFAWLLWGDFAWSLKERSIGQALQILLMKFGASDMLTGFLLGSLPAGIAMFLCPVIGYRSDRHRGRWGRRIPFILVPLPIVVLSMIGLAFSPRLGALFHHLCGAHSLGLNSSILMFLGFFWVLFAFAGIIMNSVSGALINDVVPTAVLGRFYGAWRAFSLGAGMLFSFWIFGLTEAHYEMIFIVIGLLFGGGLLLMCLKVKEGEYPPPPPAEPDKGVKGIYEATRGYMKTCFGSSYYLLVFVVLGAPAIAFMPFNLFSIFYAKSIHMSMDEYGKWNAVMFLVSFALSYPIGMLADRVHPVRLSIIGLAAYGLVCLWGGFFVRSTLTFIIAVLACGLITGIWMTATASLPQRLLPASKFAEYLSAAGIINCLCQIVIGPVLGVFLDSCGHVYSYVFFVGAGLTALCLWACVVVHRRFMKFGGPEHYVAPE